MKRWYYQSSLHDFRAASPDTILGAMARASEFAVETTQRDAWLAQIEILRDAIAGHQGTVFLEYSIPRMGRRVDAIVLLGPIIFVLEFKVNSQAYHRADIDQVWDYALDLKNFHEASHHRYIAPVLIATEAPAQPAAIAFQPDHDKTLVPITVNAQELAATIEQALLFLDGTAIDPGEWSRGRYCPTPTIIEAATALYNNHSVADISRSDAGAKNLASTSAQVASIIKTSRDTSRKSICFVTGVPGAGKTLVGLNIATTHVDRYSDLYSVYLSGNGPLVKVLREALVRDKVARASEAGKRLTKADARSEVKMFIQNVHNFRDDCLADTAPPIEHVALFDEAQRAWNVAQTASFMKRKRNQANFSQSEPEFLISCLDRHPDWATIVCLVGGGQEINTGEAGIQEWIDALQTAYPHWNIYVSSHLTDSEYGVADTLQRLARQEAVTFIDDLHLAINMRSFRAEHVSLWVKQVLDRQPDAAAQTLQQLKDYPIVLTRSFAKAKQWLRDHARGSERYGMVVSSQAERLKPYAIDIRPNINPIHWFLNGKDDVRSSYYLEDVATEFHIQGLELDWACVAWDADLRYSPNGWIHKSFRGTKWQNIRQEARQRYLLNAYRVLLTRARQGMVIVVPPGDPNDPTRQPKFYDATYNYLASLGLPVL